MRSRQRRRNRPLVILSAAVVLAALAGTGAALLLNGKHQPGTASPATRTTVRQHASTPASIEPTTATPGAGPTSPATQEQSTGPQGQGATDPRRCGTVLDGIVNQEIEVTVAAGTVSCQEALGLVNTYYNHPPVPPQGSGGFVQIRSWTCSSASGGTSSEPATPGTAPDPRART